MHLLSQGPVHPPQATASTLVADGLLSNPGSLVASMGELLLARSLKVAAVVERVGLRTTRLRAVDGIVWHVRTARSSALATSPATGPGCWSTWR